MQCHPGAGTGFWMSGTEPMHQCIWRDLIYDRRRIANKKSSRMENSMIRTRNRVIQMKKKSKIGSLTKDKFVWIEKLTI
jgi:hypothetical protein